MTRVGSQRNSKKKNLYPSRLVLRPTQFPLQCVPSPLFWRLSSRGVALTKDEVKENAELNLSFLCIFKACYRQKFLFLPPH
jgi:hypothetical protein